MKKNLYTVNCQVKGEKGNFHYIVAADQNEINYNTFMENIKRYFWDDVVFHNFDIHKIDHVEDLVSGEAYDPVLIPTRSRAPKESNSKRMERMHEAPRNFRDRYGFFMANAGNAPIYGGEAVPQAQTEPGVIQPGQAVERTTEAGTLRIMEHRFAESQPNNDMLVVDDFPHTEDAAVLSNQNIEFMRRALRNSRIGGDNA